MINATHSTAHAKSLAPCWLGHHMADRPGPAPEEPHYLTFFVTAWERVPRAVLTRL